MADNNHFEQPEEALNYHPELAESVTSETSSHKMRIDELTGEEDHSMDVQMEGDSDNNSVPVSVPQPITTSKFDYS